MTPCVRRLLGATLMLTLGLGSAPVPAAAQPVGDVRFLVTASWLAQLGGQPTLVVVDMRPATAYAEGHIPGAINLPVQTLAQPSSDEDQVGPWQVRASELLGGARFLPVHWGTFNLAMHDWDEPAEVLLEAGRGVPLLMPHLGEAVEPARTGAPTPWWRTPGAASNEAAPALTSEAEPALDPNAPLAWPID